MFANFTYERNDTMQKLETYEWDNTWWDHPGDCSKPRILLVGDSITCQYRGIASRLLEGDMYVDQFGTSKGIDNMYFVDAIALFMRQMPRCELIQFNNGLHGWHLSIAKYEEYYRRTVDALRKSFPDVRWLFAATTPLRVKNNVEQFDARNRIVQERNKVAQKIAEENQSPWIDYYSLIEEKKEFFAPDGTHLEESGCELLASCLVKYIKGM